QGEAARLLQDVKIVLDPHLGEVERSRRGIDDVDDHAGVRERAHHRRHKARALRKTGGHEEADAESLHVALTSRPGGAARRAQPSRSSAPSNSAAYSRMSRSDACAQSFAKSSAIHDMAESVRNTVPQYASRR